MAPKEVNFFSRAEPFSLPSDLPLIIALGNYPLSSFSTYGYYYMNFKGRGQPKKGIYEDD